MSTHWDLYCRDCDRWCGFNINYGDHALIKLWKLRFAYKFLHELVVRDAPGHYNDVEMKLLGDENGGMYSFPKFAFDHSTHTVVPRNEYGKYVSQCYEDVHCESCLTRHTCRRKYGHEGPCTLTPSPEDAA